MLPQHYGEGSLCRLARLQMREKKIIKSNCLQEIIHFCNLLHFVVSLHYANSHEKAYGGKCIHLGPDNVTPSLSSAPDV